MDHEILGWAANGCAGAALLGAWALKRRIVFPRGGYVEPRGSPAVKFALVAFIAAVILIAIFGPMRLPPMESRFVEPGFAAGLAVMCLVSGWKGKSTSLFWFGVYLVGLALLLWFPERAIERNAWLEVGGGAPLAVAGAIRLRNFLKANPRPVETTNG